MIKAHEHAKPTTTALVQRGGVERSPPRSGIAWVDPRVEASREAGGLPARAIWLGSLRRA